MITVLTFFLLSLGVGLIATPVIARMGNRFGLVDRPSRRKIHTQPIPRIGGIVIYLAFFGPFSGLFVYSNSILNEIVLMKSLVWVCAGATLIFLTGLADDIYALRPCIKLIAQVAAALLAYLGGVSISEIKIPWFPLVSFGWLSLPITMIWFLLVINAINLIDGLDGLAAGVSLFVSLAMLVSCIVADRIFVAVGFAALAGACLGFLRYNFNPASIFMGDSGSYFLGYTLASLGILGSMKSQTTVAILIPIIALGLPLMDTILAPIRRLLTGQDVFQPDKSHIHHKLLALGLSQRNAVWLMYGVTVVMGSFALLLINARDQRAAMILLIIGISLFYGIRKLGYLEYLAVDKVRHYIQDVTDVMGLKRDRRTFLCRQIAISEAGDAGELWNRIIDALDLLRIDKATITFSGTSFEVATEKLYTWCRLDSVTMQSSDERHILTIDLPLADDQMVFGLLHLKKNLGIDPISHYTLQRIEHLRRSIVRRLRAFEDSKIERRIV